MSPTLDAFLRSWPFDPWLLGALLAAAEGGEAGALPALRVASVEHEPAAQVQGGR